MTTQSTQRKTFLRRGALLAGTAILGIGLVAGVADRALLQTDQAFAQPIQLSGTQTQLPSFADLVDKVKPAVVSVRVKTEVAAASDQQNLDDLPPQLRRFFRDFGIHLPSFYGWFGLITVMTFVYYTYVYIGTVASISGASPACNALTMTLPKPGKENTRSTMMTPPMR